MSKLLNLFKRAGTDFVEDDCMSSGAAIAYYTIFSLPPLLVITFLVAGWLGVSHEQVDRVARQQLGLPVAAEQQGAAEGQLEKMGQRQPGSTGLGSQILGAVILIFSATGVLAQLQYVLNRVWEVEPDPQQGGVMNFITKRVLSLGMIVVLVFLLLVSLVLTTLIEEIVGWVQGGSTETAAMVIAALLNNLAAFLLATVLFAAMYKILPDVNMSWRDMWVGAALTALLFVIGKALIGWYLQSSDLGSGWGNAAASMVGVLVWVYYSSLVVLFGAELTQVWANEYGHGVEPEQGAVRTVRQKHHARPHGGAQPT